MPISHKTAIDNNIGRAGMLAGRKRTLNLPLLTRKVNLPMFVLCLVLMYVCLLDPLKWLHTSYFTTRNFAVCMCISEWEVEYPAFEPISKEFFL